MSGPLFQQGMCLLQDMTWAGAFLGVAIAFMAMIVALTAVTLAAIGFYVLLAMFSS